MERRLRDLHATEIPFRRESFDFTYGSACLLMAMRHFDPSLDPRSLPAPRARAALCTPSALGRDGSGDPERPLRYARGEISREEYQRIRADLEGRAP